MSEPQVPLMNVDIVSADQRIFGGEARMLSLASTVGELGILPRHSPLVAKLKPGEVRVTLPDGNRQFIYVSGGFLEVTPEGATILADVALRGEQIDRAAAEAARARAEEAMEAAVLFTDRDRAQAELLKAIAQIKTLEDTFREARRRRPDRRPQ
jgi:F-type H+-transporting ATPase subunit epsilon